MIDVPHGTLGAIRVKRHFKYLSYVLRHKWFVFLAACELGIPWLGLIHDWSKFRFSEWLPYARHFHNPDGTSTVVRDDTGYYKPTDTGDAKFDFAWLLHQKCNRHHWQWWILPEDEGGVKLLPMPDRYRRELLADWRGASMAQGYGWDVGSWYEKNKAKMQLHPETRQWVEEQIG